MKFVYKTLNFFNLTDDENKLSLTNFSLYVTIFKLATTTNLIYFGALLPIIGAYHHKKILKKNSLEVSETTNKINELQNSVNNLNKNVLDNNGLFDQINKQTEQTKQILAANQNSNIFVPRNRG